MEPLYLLLIANTQSNILQDLDTLRLLSKLVPGHFPELHKEGICRMVVEIIFAFDETIALGHNENVAIAQIKQAKNQRGHMWVKWFDSILLKCMDDNSDGNVKYIGQASEVIAENMNGGISFGEQFLFFPFVNNKIFKEMA